MTPAGQLVVIVAEDDPLLRLDACETLRHAGFEVLEAASGEEAMSALERQDDVDVLFTDIQMPPGTLSGLDLARRAKALRPRLTVFVTSGLVPAPAGEPPPPGRFVPKPYEIEHVAEELRAACGR
jgi:two-component system, response regulator PdtaR